MLKIRSRVNQGKKIRVTNGRYKGQVGKLIGQNIVGFTARLNSEGYVEDLQEGDFEEITDVEMERQEVLNQL